MYSGSSGLQIAYLSGTENATCDQISFSQKDVNELIESSTRIQQFKGVDILITSQWAKGIEKYASGAVSMSHFFCIFISVYL